MGISILSPRITFGTVTGATSNPADHGSTEVADVNEALSFNAIAVRAATLQWNASSH